MINHKKIVKAIKDYSSEMGGLVSSTHYCKTMQEVEKKVEHAEKRAILYSLTEMDNVSDEDYDILKYKGTIIDKVGVSEEEVVNSEEDNMYVVGAFEDYLNYELDDRVKIAVEFLNNVENKGSVYTSVNIEINVRVDKRESLWSSNG